MDELNMQLEMPAWATVVSDDGYSTLKGNTNTAIENWSGQLQRKE